MRILHFGSLDSVGLPEDAEVTKVASSTHITEFRRLINEVRNYQEATVCFWLPLSEAKQEIILELLADFKGNVILTSPTIDLSLRPALVELLVYRGQPGLVVQPAGLLSEVTGTLRTDCRHRRSFGIWLRRQGKEIRREDRIFARALDNLSVQVSG